MQKNRYRFQFSLIIAVFSISIGLFIAEVTVRKIDPYFFSYPTKAFNPILGWTARPDSLMYRQPGDSVVRYETNPLGFRDRVQNIQNHVKDRQGKDHRIRRIAVIGDSFSESLQVDIPDTFWSRLKVRLNLGSVDYWEVLNFGVSDYGTVQEYLCLKEFAMNFHPDIVILQVFPLNDIANNSLAMANIASSNDAYRPYLDPEKGFNNITHLNPVTSWLRCHSTVMRNLFSKGQKTFGPWGREMLLTTYKERMVYVRTVLKELDWPQDMDHTPLLFNTFAEPEHQLAMVREGWRATEVAITNIQAITSANDTELIILVVPHENQLPPRVESISKRLNFDIDPLYAEKRIAQLVKGDHVSVIGLVDSFRTHSDVVIPYLEGHFNLATHDLVAGILERSIRQVFSSSFAAEQREGDENSG